MSNALALITDEIYGARDGFMAVLADRSINFEREAGFAIQAIQRNDYTLRVASDNRQSVIDAVTNIAAIGISLNPAKKQAYLVPRDKQICLDISYMGLMDLAMATGSIKWAQAELVCENDGFARGRFDEPPTHSFNPFSKDRGAVIGVYVVVKTADGDYLTHTMEIGAVNDIRDRSESWKAYVQKKIKSCPWVSDTGEMIKKTCVKQAYKYWPKTERLERAIHYLNTEGAEGFDLIRNGHEKPEGWIDVMPVIAQVSALATDADALAFWRANNAKFAKQKADYERLKDAIAAHRLSLRAKDESRTVDVQAKPVSETAEPDPDFVAGLDRGAQ